MTIARVGSHAGPTPERIRELGNCRIVTTNRSGIVTSAIDRLRIHCDAETTALLFVRRNREPRRLDFTKEIREPRTDIFVINEQDSLWDQRTPCDAALPSDRARSVERILYEDPWAPPPPRACCEVVARTNPG